MSATSRHAGGPSRLTPEVLLGLIAVAVAVIALTELTLVVQLAARLDHRHTPPVNPIELLGDFAHHRRRWTQSMTTILIWTLAIAVLLLLPPTVYGLRRTRARLDVDRAARRMGRGRQLEALTRRGAQRTADRLGVHSPGLPLGTTVATSQPLLSSWEDCTVDIWGPRTGKSTSRAIPAILAAPGAVLATSNKRDLADATRDLRAAQAPVWVFDPQDLVGEAASWWWNPLSYVTDEVRAARLADVFASASRDPSARTDAYFDSAGQDLLAQLLLAAAQADRPITQVYLWLTDPRQDEPVEILRRHGHHVLAAALQAVVNAPEKQRGGIYGTAQQIAAVLTNSQAVRWVTPPLAGADRRQFDPHAFVRSQQTLYSLSKEGRGSAAPLVTALTVAVTEAAEDFAKSCPGGRLPVPMVAVLDEAANVCRWRELPNIYSHYGSRGIVLMTILQSWSQGVEAWGREGMRKLWSAANVKVYGGGVSEVEFLNELSQLVGDFDLNTTALTQGQGKTSTNRATRRERILDVADLTALPRGRVVVLASGMPAALVKPRPWMAGPHADAIRASIAAHDPARTAVQLPA